MRSLQVAELRGSEPQSAELLARRHLVRGWRAEDDADYVSLIDDVLGDDA